SAWFRPSLPVTPLPRTVSEHRSGARRCAPREGHGVAGKFVLKKGTTGKFRFSLLSTNGQVVATSESYNSKASAMGGIRSVKSLAADATVEDQTTKEWAAAEPARTAAAAKKAAAAAKKKIAKKAAKRLPAPPSKS
ncbi:MAG: YegP family protein, partial [Actinomycetota bacterium]|nr:YegP family protein [Actinomycetota bacterium]